MKKNYVLLMTLFASSVTASAAVDYAEVAEQKAIEFLQDKAGMMPQKRAMSAACLGSDMEIKSVSASKDAEFYSFNGRMGGNDCFVLMTPSSDEDMQVIGYSTDGNFSFESVPDAMKAWMQAYRNVMEQGKERINHYPELPTIEPIAPFVTTKWGQGEPFNKMCPMEGTTLLLTGCTATAMAQVLNYYKSDVKGEGLIEYVQHDLELSVDFSKVSYEWDKMLDVYEEGNYTDEQADAVARLMLDAGVAARATYKLSATSAGAPREGMSRQYKYNVEHYYRNWIPTKQWIQIIHEELQAKRPILYGGSTSGSGHLFVVDGIDDENHMHVNWGWAGLDDGYYDITFCHAPSQSDPYIRNQKMLANLFPRSESEPVEGIVVDAGYTQYQGDYNNNKWMELVGASLNRNDSQVVEVAMCLTQDGEIKTSTDFKEQSLSSSGYNTITFKGFNSVPADGVYLMEAYYKDENGELKKVKMPESGAATVTYTNGKMEVKNPYEYIVLKNLQLLDVEPRSELIAKCPMYLRLQTYIDYDGTVSGGGIYGINQGRIKLKFIHQETGDEYETTRYIDLDNLYGQVLEVKDVNVTPINSDNGFKMPAGCYKVVLDDPEMTVMKDIYVELQPEKNYVVMDGNEKVISPDRPYFSQSERNRFYYFHQKANDYRGRETHSIYARPVGGTEEDEVLLWTSVSPENSFIQSDLTDDKCYFYPLEGDYELYIRYMTPEGERTVLNPDYQPTVVHILKDESFEFPKVYNTDEYTHRDVKVGEEQTLEIRMKTDEWRKMTFVAYIYDKEHTEMHEVVVDDVQFEEGKEQAVKIPVLLEKEGEYEMYLYVRTITDRKTMVTDGNNRQMVYKLTVGQSGVDTPQAGSLNVYPNPVDDVVTVENAEDGLVSVFDFMGRKVASGMAENGKAEIRVSGLASGFYVVRVGNATTKLIKR